MDAGAGDDTLMVCAIAAGAAKATGYELPENDAHRFIFSAQMLRLDFSTQLEAHILDLCICCETLNVLTLFQDRKGILRKVS